MSLIKCKECSKEISETAKSCPHCGKSSPSFTKFVLWILGILFFIVFIGQCTYNNSIKELSSTSKESSPIQEKYTKKSVKYELKSVYLPLYTNEAALCCEANKDGTYGISEKKIIQMMGKKNNHEIQSAIDNKYMKKFVGPRGLIVPVIAHVQLHDMGLKIKSRENLVRRIILKQANCSLMPEGIPISLSLKGERDADLAFTQGKVVMAEMQDGRYISVNFLHNHNDNDPDSKDMIRKSEQTDITTTKQIDEHLKLKPPENQVNIRIN